MFFVLILGFPVVILFVLFSVAVCFPVFATVGAVRGVRRFNKRQEATERLRGRLEEIPDPFPSTDRFVRQHFELLLTKWGDRVPLKSVVGLMVRTAGTLYSAQGLDPLVPPPPGSPDAIALGRYRDELRAGIRKAEDAPRMLALIHEACAAAFLELARKLPASCFTAKEKLREDAPAPLFSAPLFDMVRDAGQAVSDVTRAFHDPQLAGAKVFAGLREQLDRNLYEASGQQYPAPAHKLIQPHQHEGSPQEIVKAYLGYTPLQHVFDVEVPFPITPERRMEHWHLIGSSGWGKTQCLQHIILHDLIRPDPPALVVVDSQGDMLDKIQRLQIFAEDPDRLVIIDPAHDPSLNMFDMTTERLTHHSPLVREQVEAGVIELYAYIFGALASDLTAKQGTAFTFVVRLMLAIPGATLHTLLELMEDQSKSFGESPFAQHAQKLDGTARSFFDNQFYNRQAFGSTRQQIARRLYGVLSVPAFDRMFSAKRNRLDMFAAIQAGRVVLVNTAKSLLKSDASALFGRYMIAQVMAAAFERVAVPFKDRKQAFLIIDEAAEYFDDSLESLLSQARKFQLGVLFAHQHMEQLTPALRSSVASNTSIKMAGGVSDRDARMLDADMRTTSDFIGSMRKRPRGTEFAAYIRNETPRAVRIEVPFGSLEAAARMSADEHRRLVERNRARYSAGADDSDGPRDHSDAGRQSAAEPSSRQSEMPRSDQRQENVRPSKDW